MAKKVVGEIKLQLPAGKATPAPPVALRYPRSLREFVWTLALFAARLHLWLRIFWQVRVRQRPLSELWQRVESTK